MVEWNASDHGFKTRLIFSIKVCVLLSFWVFFLVSFFFRVNLDLD